MNFRPWGDIVHTSLHCKWPKQSADEFLFMSQFYQQVKYSTESFCVFTKLHLSSDDGHWAPTLYTLVFSLSLTLGRNSARLWLEMRALTAEEGKSSKPHILITEELGNIITVWSQASALARGHCLEGDWDHSHSFAFKPSTSFNLKEVLYIMQVHGHAIARVSYFKVGLLCISCQKRVLSWRTAEATSESTLASLFLAWAEVNPGKPSKATSWNCPFLADRIISSLSTLGIKVIQ